MADFLVIDGTAIPVAWPQGAGDRDYEEVGDRARADDGTLLSSVQTQKFTQPIITKAMTLAQKNTIRGIVTDSPPHTCSGDLLGGSVDCDIKLGPETVITVAGNLRLYVLRFDLIEI